MKNAGAQFQALQYLAFFDYQAKKFVKNNLVAAYIVNNIFKVQEFDITDIYKHLTNTYK